MLFRTTIADLPFKIPVMLESESIKNDEKLSSSRCFSWLADVVIDPRAA